MENQESNENGGAGPIVSDDLFGNETPVTDAMCRKYDANNLSMIQALRKCADFETALRRIIAIKNKTDGADRDEIEEAREIANSVLSPNVEARDAAKNSH